MKKLRMLFLSVFIISVLLIFIQIKDKIESENIKDEVSRIYNEDKDQVLVNKKLTNTDKKDTATTILKEKVVILDEFKPLIKKTRIQ